MLNEKEALEYLVGLGEANIKDIELPDGEIETFSDKPLYRLEKHIPMAEPFTVNTLTGLVDYIKSNIDLLNTPMLVIVETPTTVRVVSKLNENHEREHVIYADAEVPYFKFNSFMDKENFCINIQSKFVENDDRRLLLSFAGTVSNGTVAEYGDDGISQSATVKVGVASRSTAKVPSPLKLKPYRTFIEIEQPESSFIFRMKDINETVACALYEADGGAWGIAAKKAIKEYLETALDGCKMYTVIA